MSNKTAKLKSKNQSGQFSLPTALTETLIDFTKGFQKNVKELQITLNGKDAQQAKKDLGKVLTGLIVKSPTADSMNMAVGSTGAIDLFSYFYEFLGLGPDALIDMLLLGLSEMLNIVLNVLQPPN